MNEEEYEKEFGNNKTIEERVFDKFSSLMLEIESHRKEIGDIDKDLLGNISLDSIDKLTPQSDYVKGFLAGVKLMGTLLIK